MTDLPHDSGTNSSSAREVREPASRESRSSVGPPAGTPPPPSARGEVRHRRAIGWRSRDVVRAAGLVLAMYLAIQLIWFAHALFLVTFLGILFGIAVSAGVDRLERFKIPRGLGAAFIVLSFLGLLGGFGASLAPTIREQGAELKQKLPQAVDRVEEWMNRRQSGMFGALLGGRAATPAAPAVGQSATAPSRVGQTGARPAAGTAGPAGAVTAPRADSAAAAPASDIKSTITSKLSGATRFLFPFLSSTVQAVGGILLIIFLSIYFAADPGLYQRGVLALLPPRRRAQGAEVMRRVAIVLRKWLLTQLIAMVAIFAVTTAVLLFLGVKAPFALGLLAGLFEFIPTVGPLLSAIPSVAMGFLDSPQKALYVVIAYWGIQFLENHILIPLLMKGGMDLPPALTVLTQALLALVFGFLGLMVAVPLLATVMVMVQVLYLEPRAKGDGPGAAGENKFDPDLDEALEGAAAPAR